MRLLRVGEILRRVAGAYVFMYFKAQARLSMRRIEQARKIVYSARRDIPVPESEAHTSTIQIRYVTSIYAGGPPVPRPCPPMKDAALQKE